MAEAQGTQDPMPCLVSHDLHRTGLRPLGLYDPCFYGGLGCERHSLGSGVLVRHTLFSKDFRVCRNHETIKGQSWVPPGAFPTVHSSQMTVRHGLSWISLPLFRVWEEKWAIWEADLQCPQPSRYSQVRVLWESQ